MANKQYNVPLEFVPGSGGGGGGGTFSFNGSTGSISLVAGTNISLASAASTITIAASDQTSSLSYVQSLNGSSGILSVSAGANIGIGQAGSTITVSASSYSTLVSITTAAGGASLGAANTASSTAFPFVAGSNITLSQNSTSPAITFIGPAAAAAATQSLSGGGTSVTGTAVSFALIAGNNISLASASGAGSLTLTVNAGGASRLSLTQNVPLQEIGGPIYTATGTITGALGPASSLSLQRIFLPAAIALSEVDLAMAMSFPNTSQGAGTMSQSFVLYSFGNSSSLATVASASSTYAWTTGTVTAGGSVSLTQFQGGWSISKLHPMTFASTSISAGEYVAGNLLAFAQGSSTWTLNIFGPLGSMTVVTSLTAVSTTGSTVSALTAFSTAPTNATVISNAGTALANILSTSGTGAVTEGRATVATTAATTVSAAVATVWTAAPSNLARTMFTAAPSAASVLSNVGTLAYSPMISLSLSTQQIIPLAPGVPNLVYIGTGSTTSALPSVFIAGIMSTGAVPTSIAITAAAVTYSGTQAGAQPYFALVGA